MLIPDETLMGSRMVGTKGSSSTNEDYSAIKAKIDNDYQNCQAEWQTFWAESNIDIRLEAGDSQLSNQLSPFNTTSGRDQWVFNRVRPLLNMVSGWQRRNRKSTIVVPTENADQKTADQFTKVMMNIYKKQAIYEEISEAFHQGACITGLSLMQVYLDFRNDPISGDIKVTTLPPTSFYIDPYFRKTDLSDCSFIWTRSYLTYSAAAALMPEKYDEIMELASNTGTTVGTQRFQYMPEAYGMSKKKRLAYDEYYYRDFRDQKLLIDKETGETLDITLQDKMDVDAFLEQYPSCTVINQKVPTVRLAIMIQDKVFYDGPQPTGIDEYPFVAITGYYSSMLPNFYSRIQGIARSLRDPQALFNHRIITSADMAESMATTGWIFKEGSVIDVKHLFQPGAGRIIPMKREANLQTDIIPITAPNIPPSFFQLQETFDKELNMVSGITESNLGQQVNDESGYLSALRQSAGMMTLEPIFDRLNLSQNRLGEIIMSIIQRNYTPGKIKNLLEGEEPAPLFYNKSFGKYNCAVENGFDTETQRQLEFAQLIKLKEMGFNIPPKVMINAATLQKKDELIQAMEEMEQAQMQAQQEQHQAQIQEAQSRVGLTNARMQSDIGLAKERESRVYSNIGLMEERREAAIKDKTQADINMLKALKEIEGIDLAHIDTLVNLLQLLKEQSTEEKETNQFGESVNQEVSSKIL